MPYATKSGYTGVVVIPLHPEDVSRKVVTFPTSYPSLYPAQFICRSMIYPAMVSVPLVLSVHPISTSSQVLKIVALTIVLTAANVDEPEYAVIL